MTVPDIQPRSVDLDKVKRIVVDVGQRPDKEIIPLLLFKGNVGLHRARALLSFTLSMMEANVSSGTEIVKIAQQSRDLIHLEGLHSPLQHSTVSAIFSRIHSSSTIGNCFPRLQDYIHSVRGIHVFTLDHISRWSADTKRAWRYKAALTEVKPKDESSQFYPFASRVGTAVRECDLLHTIHGLVPKSLPENLRPDVCQDLIVAVLSGAITVENLRDDSVWYVKTLLKQHGDRYRNVSLDDVLGDRDRATALGI